MRGVLRLVALVIYVAAGYLIGSYKNQVFRKVTQASMSYEHAFVMEFIVSR